MNPTQNGEYRADADRGYDPDDEVVIGGARLTLAFVEHMMFRTFWKQNSVLRTWDEHLDAAIQATRMLACISDEPAHYEAVCAQPTPPTGSTPVRGEKG